MSVWGWVAILALGLILLELWSAISRLQKTVENIQIRQKKQDKAG